MSFSRFQAWLKPCLGSLEQGTGLQCLWTLWRARIQRAAEQNAEQNAEQPVGHASDMNEIRNIYSFLPEIYLSISLAPTAPRCELYFSRQLT